MANVIAKRKRMWHKNVTHDFLYMNDPDSGYSFPVEEPLSKEALANYEYVKSHPEMFVDEGIADRGWYYWENAKAICECGKTIELYDQYMGACNCPYCGRWHNMFGQALVNPEYWEEN